MHNNFSKTDNYLNCESMELPSPATDNKLSTSNITFNRLLLSMELTTLYCQNPTSHTNTMCQQNAANGTWVHC